MNEKTPKNAVKITVGKGWPDGWYGFGTTVNCTGLLTGQDILKAVKRY